MDGDGGHAVVICGGQGMEGNFLLKSCYIATNQKSFQSEHFDMQNGYRTAAASTVIDNGLTLWITGGWDFSSRQNTSELVTLNPVSSSKNGPQLILALESHCMVQLNESHAMLIGGSSDFHDPEDRTWCYSNLHQQQWASCPNLNYRRKNLACGVLYDNMLDQTVVMVAGGIHVDMFGDKTVEHLFIGDNSRWDQGWTIDNGVLCYGTFGPSSVVSHDKSRLIIIGGRAIGYPNPYHKSLCSCTITQGSPNCEVMKQELQIGRGLSVAMLIPDSFANCQ